MFKMCCGISKHNDATGHSSITAVTAQCIYIYIYIGRGSNFKVGGLGGGGGGESHEDFARDQHQQD